jgi:glycolate oxidase
MTVLDAFRRAVGPATVVTDADLSGDYAHDEALTVEPVLPEYLAWPTSTVEVAALLAIAS